ncbi:hypothetical protein E0L36_06260 [Streptomyces sp. AJS327]|uniref:hypothetical protein n=1 Tax=Streptomyces sp. AJS327 TaxID=2545265 RepID=UPI0015E01884|nr:hypothetical protein [Streptomyces sp. AJS327]MBA0050515.1 hypothetical protein [Streptomyces sp. AJS327]
MTARPLPGSTRPDGDRGGSRPGPASAGQACAAAQTRLPWWAVALPAIAFATLLLLLTSGGEAGAAEWRDSGAQSPLELFELVWRVVAG